MAPQKQTGGASNPAAAISIVIPCLNEQSSIVRSVRNAKKAFSGLALEVIVVDGGSTDSTCANILASGDMSVRLIHADKPGRAWQMVLGANNASGDILMFLHADTLLPLDAGVHIQTFLSAREQWGFFKLRFDDPRLRFRFLAFMINLRSRLSAISTGDQCQFVRRESYNNIGGFPVQRLMEDVELASRLKQVTSPFIIQSKVQTSARRWRTRGYLKTIGLMWSLRYRYWRGESPESLFQRYYHY